MNKQYNNNVIMYRHPMGVIVRPKRPSYRFTNFNDRSPEYGAMSAHLRATGYGGDRSDSQQRATNTRSSRPWLAGNQTLLKLRREFETAARDNFAWEAALFILISLAGIAWPTIHTMKAFAGSVSVANFNLIHSTKLRGLKR